MKFHIILLLFDSSLNIIKFNDLSLILTMIAN
jgi:hypothetical protein